MRGVAGVVLLRGTPKPQVAKRAGAVVVKLMAAAVVRVRRVVGVMLRGPRGHGMLLPVDLH